MPTEPGMPVSEEDGKNPEGADFEAPKDVEQENENLTLCELIDDNREALTWLQRQNDFLYLLSQGRPQLIDSLKNDYPELWPEAEKEARETGESTLSILANRLSDEDLRHNSYFKWNINIDSMEEAIKWFRDQFLDRPAKEVFEETVATIGHDNAVRLVKSFRKVITNPNILSEIPKMLEDNFGQAEKNTIRNSQDYSDNKTGTFFEAISTGLLSALVTKDLPDLEAENVIAYYLLNGYGRNPLLSRVNSLSDARELYQTLQALSKNITGEVMNSDQEYHSTGLHFMRGRIIGSGTQIALSEIAHDISLDENSTKSFSENEDFIERLSWAKEDDEKGLLTGEPFEFN